MDSKISVIIPTFNRRSLLAETLDSVFHQTWSDFEIIVVDDGSEDDTLDLDALSSDRLMYHRIEHVGASAARNAGLELAHGEYIAFLDSDDLWERQFLERMRAAFEQVPQAGFVYCDYTTFDRHGVVQNAYLPARHKLRGNLFAQLLESDFISTGALLIRRTCIQHTGGFDPKLEIAHDWDLWLRLSREFEAEYVDEPLVNIRIDSGGLTCNTPQLYADNLRILAKLRKQVEVDEQLKLVRRNIVACHRGLSRYFWSVGRPALAFKHGTLMLAALAL